LPEIWSYGLRNPWRFSFDRSTGAMYIGDVGEQTLEEINYEPPNTPGRNYGWPNMEGTSCFPIVETCSTAGFQQPIATYNHESTVTGGFSVTGGFVYRGTAIPGLVGSYLYADYVSGNFWAVEVGANGQVSTPSRLVTSRVTPNQTLFYVSAFGQDNAGELYVLAGSPATLYKITAAP
jgi:glucose/arabinose dehydrogenase